MKHTIRFFMNHRDDSLTSYTNHSRLFITIKSSRARCWQDLGVLKSLQAESSGGTVNLSLNGREADSIIKIKVTSRRRNIVILYGRITSNIGIGGISAKFPFVSSLS